MLRWWEYPDTSFLWSFEAWVLAGQRLWFTRSMKRDPIVFALANPTPEIDPVMARKIRKDVIMATGRSDFPNQVDEIYQLVKAWFNHEVRICSWKGKKWKLIWLGAGQQRVCLSLHNEGSSRLSVRFVLDNLCACFDRSTDGKMAQHEQEFEQGHSSKRSNETSC